MCEWAASTTSRSKRVENKLARVKADIFWWDSVIIWPPRCSLNASLPIDCIERQKEADKLPASAFALRQLRLAAAHVPLDNVTVRSLKIKKTGKTGKPENLCGPKRTEQQLDFPLIRAGVFPVLCASHYGLRLPAVQNKLGGEGPWAADAQA